MNVFEMLHYEIGSSRLFGVVYWVERIFGRVGWIEKAMAFYFSWKVARKYRRYRRNCQPEEKGNALAKQGME